MVPKEEEMLGLSEDSVSVNANNMLLVISMANINFNIILKLLTHDRRRIIEVTQNII
jgi:hypothetical protein